MKPNEYDFTDYILEKLNKRTDICCPYCGMYGWVKPEDFEERTRPLNDMKVIWACNDCGKIFNTFHELGEIGAKP
jgi:DNA-directed RNA polymerase subunit RPC12/RpoP